MLLIVFITTNYVSSNSRGNITDWQVRSSSEHCQYVYSTLARAFLRPSYFQTFTTYPPYLADTAKVTTEWVKLYAEAYFLFLQSRKTSQVMFILCSIVHTSISTLFCPWEPSKGIKLKIICILNQR